tara:strand:+ start:1628 stop:2974 length:1347 start_codon:yes stop_codon:yes gene_type:complete
MSLKVIELNDSCLTVGDENGIVSQTIGFALVTSDKIEVGEKAEGQACLEPTNIFNKYWQELSLEPISHSPKIRHHADLAYAQLKNIAEVNGVDDEVIFAVPSNFTRQQLEILLGLANQCPFRVVGLVDSGLLAAASTAKAEHIVYVDIQLHQVILTELSVTGDHIEVKGVTQVPGVGIQNFQNLMMRMATDLFIAQCRFNPQHNAYTEQQLYNELNSWFFQDDKEQTFLLELKSGDAAHTAKLPKESLVAALQEYYQKINEQIKVMASSNSQLLLSENLSGLPGYVSTLSSIHNLVLIERSQITKACCDFKTLIIDDKEQVHLVTRFVAEEIGIHKSAHRPAEHHLDIATHILYDNKAIKICDIEIKSSIPERANFDSSNVLYMNLKTSAERLGNIDKRGDTVYFNCGDHRVFLNDNIITGEHVLKLGDRIRFSEQSKAISVIKVENG